MPKAKTRPDIEPTIPPSQRPQPRARRVPDGCVPVPEHLADYIPQPYLRAFLGVEEGAELFGLSPRWLRHQVQIRAVDSARFGRQVRVPTVALFELVKVTPATPTGGR
jgi:hypothetical protein